MRRRVVIAGALLVLSQSAACLSAPTVVVDDLLEPMGTTPTHLPDDLDLAAARLAIAALVAEPRAIGAEDAPDESYPGDVFEGSRNRVVADPRVEAALARIRELDASEALEDLEALATDLRNATLDDPVAHRAASRDLRRRWTLDPRLEARLDRTVQDDPLRLAGRRQFDGWHRLWARTFNAVAEPLGSSAITGFVIAPFTLANSLVHYFAEFSNSEPLSLTGRQALALRERYVARYPGTETATKVQRKIDKARPKLAKTLAVRRLRAAESALDADRPDLALHHAQAAESFLAAHPKKNGRTQRRVARRIVEAETEIARSSELRLESLDAIRTRNETRAAEIDLASALLVRPVAVDVFDRELAELAAVSPDESRGRVDFVRALVQHETGFEAASRKRLARIAGRDLERDPMARHAKHLLLDDWQNPYGAFRRLSGAATRNEVAWRLAGEWINRPRYPNLPAPVAYLIDTPAIAITIVLAPVRFIFSPWSGAPDFRRGASLAGYRYLNRYPEGEAGREVTQWLYDYESDREHWGRALRLADWIPEFDPEERAELVESTAEDRLARLDKIDRRDSRASILTGVAKEFPDSESGKEAGLLARAEWQDASPQQIRISRSFLLENPSVAGPSGIGLNPVLLNEDPADAELHPDGVLLRGGRVLEIRLVADGGDDDDLPDVRMKKISKARLARIASALDEAVQRNSLIDVDARHRSDAKRDVYLERAGLGLTETVDPRANAGSTFVYQSLRERYGLVRGRDSILPFDLVLRGSLGDFSLGAFPRWRPPKETPDAYLYR